MATQPQSASKRHLPSCTSRPSTLWRALQHKASSEFQASRPLDSGLAHLPLTYHTRRPSHREANSQLPRHCPSPPLEPLRILLARQPQEVGGLQVVVHAAMRVNVHKPLADVVEDLHEEATLLRI